MKNWFRNYKTTLFGLGAGALNLLANGTEPMQVAFASGIALLGLLAKDADKTGTEEKPRL